MTSLLKSFDAMAEYKPEYAVDIEKMFASKGGHIPKFAVSWLKKFFHLDFINSYLVQGREGVDFCTGTLEYLDVKLDVRGLENVPADGTLYTFVSNHPLGGIDGVALGSIVGRQFGGKVRYLVNDLLMNIKGLAPICVPVNKLGGQARNLPQLINEAFHSDNHMILFPAGLCSRRIDGKIQDLPWGKAFINKSVETQRAVVPVHFVANNSKRFYRIAAWCKRIGLKFNLAMAFLPDEMYRGRHGTFTVIFGKPINYTTFDKSRTPYGWAQWVREEVYKL